MSILSSQASDASDASVTPMAPAVEAGHILSSSTSSYSVLEFIGEGCFGRVVRCQKLETKEVVAVKILKDIHDIEGTEKELSMLEHISVLNPDHTNVVKFFEWFDHMGQTCLAV
ncbi:Homeodomain-interacting protein kinase 1 [Larimichthys crocea]|uniref:Uncharacterized protein n=1 Tax=Larimichthys crocea TaxID=215358 RepID=A0ACD3R7S3_LARCR|nr:Homeodomain-interacting protein kinase 1 [Larimichthys crocea]